MLTLPSLRSPMEEEAPGKGKTCDGMVSTDPWLGFCWVTLNTGRRVGS